MTKQMSTMIALALYHHGTPVADKRSMADCFTRWDDKIVLWYNRGIDTKIIVREVEK